MTKEELIVKLNDYIKKLLNLSNKDNKQVDLHIDQNGRPYVNEKEVFVLYQDGAQNFGDYFYGIAKSRIGKMPSVLLENSSLEESEQRIAEQGSVLVKWRTYAEHSEKRATQKILNDFVDGVYEEMNKKGNNPLFLSIGAVRWKIQRGKTDEVVTSPLLIFPIRLVRNVNNQPIRIEFVDDDVVVNECFLQLFQDIFENTISAFPQPEGEDFDGIKYFREVASYVQNHQGNGDTVFEWLPDLVAVSTYTHDDICMYRDIMRKYTDILENPLIQHMFAGGKVPPKQGAKQAEIRMIDKYDSVQQAIVQAVLTQGESIKVQGPPGTGKTITIANILGACMYAGKKVLFVSKKAAALEEVYRKLPDDLRPFVMLLTKETENGIAKYNPNEVHKMLLKAYRLERRDLNWDRINSQDENLRRRLLQLGSLLTSYYQRMFEDKLGVGYNAYEAFTEYIKYAETDCPRIDFLQKGAVRKVEYKRFLNMLASVEKIAAGYRTVTDEYQIKPIENPWFGLKNGVNFPYNNSYEPIEKLAQALQRDAQFPKKAEKISLRDMMTIAQIDWKQGKIDAFSKLDLKKLCDGLSELMQLKPEEHPKAATYTGMLQNDTDTDTLYKVFAIQRGCGDLTLETLRAVYPFFTPTVMSLLREHFDTIRNKFILLHDAMSSAKESGLKLSKYFGMSFASSEAKKVLDNGLQALSKYFGKREVRFGLLDMAPKKAMAQVREYLRDDKKDIGNEEVVQALQVLSEYEKNVRIATDYMEDILLILDYHGKYGLEDFDKLFKVFFGCQSAEELQAALQAVSLLLSEYNENTLKNLRAYAGFIEENSIKDVMDFLTFRNLYLQKKKAVAQINAKFCPEGYSPVLDNKTTAKDLEKIYLNLCGIRALLESGAQQEVLTFCKEQKDLIKKAGAQMVKFANMYTEELLKTQSVYHDLATIYPASVIVFARECIDRNSFHAMYDITQELLESGNAFAREFFKGFLTKIGGQEYSFVDIFKYSFYAMAINDRKAELDEFAGGRLNMLIEEFDEKENALSENNVSMVLKKELDRIANLKKNCSESYLFLQNERSSYVTLRRMFKDKAAQIMNLLSCFIMSPSTVSLLLRDPVFSQFDLVVFDEASQIEPQYIIPVLSRAQQCVVFGDEYQMPPMEFFQAKDIEAKWDEETMGTIEVKSALDLITANECMTAISLRCHYRSQSEPLIAYSSKYYPEMITFPSIRTSSESLGIRDYLIPIGKRSMAQGQNHAEAEKVVELVQRHIEQNADLSLGVLTFGQKQAELIVSMLNREKDIRAWTTRQGEKFSVCAVEKMQGQEYDHIIMSLTYGKEDGGSAMGGFGLLQSKAFGEKVFNVAASRSKRMLSVVHSFEAIDVEESKRETIAYLADFLSKVSLYDANAVSSQNNGIINTASEEPNALIASVRNYLIRDCNVAADRILCNYGATEKSLRIPLVILNPSKTEAEACFFVENSPYVGGKAVLYADYLIRYQTTLIKRRGWEKSMRVFSYDWVYNPGIKKDVQEFVQKNVTF